MITDKYNEKRQTVTSQFQLIKIHIWKNAQIKMNKLKS